MLPRQRERGWGVPHQNRAILASLLRRDCSTGLAESRTGLQNCCRRAPVSGSARTAAGDRKIRPREGGQRERECARARARACVCV